VEVTGQHEGVEGGPLAVGSGSAVASGETALAFEDDVHGVVPGSVVSMCVGEKTTHLVAVAAELLAGQPKRMQQLRNGRVCHRAALGKSARLRIIFSLFYSYTTNSS